MSDTEANDPPSQASAAAGVVVSPNQAHGRQFVPSNFPVPAPMVCRGDVASNWEFFRQQWEDYEVATELVQQKTAVRLASLRSIMGKNCLQIYRNLSLTPEQQESVQGCLEAMEAYFKPQRNVVYERYVFNSCVQRQDENVDAYVNRLRKLASSCDFGALTDELIRDRLVIGVRDRDLKGRLLRQKGLSLQKALEMSKSNEVTKQQLKSLENEEKKNSVEEIHEFKSKGRHKKPKKTFNQNSLKPHDSKVEPDQTSKRADGKGKNNFERKVASIVAIRCTVKDETVLLLDRCVVSAIKAITSRQSATPNGRVQ